MPPRKFTACSYQSSTILAAFTGRRKPRRRDHQTELLRDDDLEMSDSKGLHRCVRSFVLEKFPAAKNRAFNDDLPLLESGIIDSLGVLDVVGFLEQTFQIRIEDDELTPDNFANVRCMVAFVARKGRPAEATAKGMSPSG